MKEKIKTYSIITIFLLLLSCGGGSSTDSIDEPTNPDVIEQMPEKPPGNEIRWTYKSKNGFMAEPLVVGDRVFIGGLDENFYCFDKNSGELVWVQILGGMHVDQPYANQEVVVAHADRTLFIFDLVTGEKRFTIKDVLGAPLIKGSMLYYASWDYKFVAFDIVKKETLWELKSRDRFTGRSAIWEAPEGTNSPDLILTDNFDNFLYAIDMATGEVVWKKSEEDRIGEEESFSSFPVVHDDRLYMGHFNKKLYCYQVQTGEELWSFQTLGYYFTKVAESDGLSYFASKNIFYAVDTDSGEERWRYYPDVEGGISSRPLIEGGLVMFGAGTSFIALNQETQKVEWRISDEYYFLGNPVLSDDKVYFGGSNGLFYCLDLVYDEE